MTHWLELAIRDPRPEGPAPRRDAGGDPRRRRLPALDLKAVFERGNTLTVYLAVPVVNSGRPNVAAEGEASEAVRYVLGTQMIEDENTGVNPQPIKVRQLNLKLLHSNQDHTGYEVIPLARITKSMKAEATPELDVTYIPPLLACDAWEPLWAGLLQPIYDRIGKKIELLANQVVSRGITFDSLGQGDPLIFAQLRELNESYAVLGILAFAQGVHPLKAYLELGRLVGQLSIFGSTRRPPDLPRYDHDDLGGLLLPRQAAHRRPAEHPGRARVQGAPVRRRRPADAGRAGAGLARIGLGNVHWRPEPARYRGVHPAPDQAGPARHEDRQLRAGRRDLPDGPGRPAIRAQPEAAAGACPHCPG